MQIKIGIIEGRACNSEITIEQINVLIENYKLNIYDDDEKVNWHDIYSQNKNEDKVLLNSIIEDRKMRVDKKILMVNRPAFAIVTINNDEIVRLEIYEAYPKPSQLSKTYDFRSLELQNQKLKNSYYEDMM